LPPEHWPQVRSCSQFACSSSLVHYPDHTGAQHKPTLPLSCTAVARVRRAHLLCCAAKTTRPLRKLRACQGEPKSSNLCACVCACVCLEVNAGNCVCEHVSACVHACRCMQPCIGMHVPLVKLLSLVNAALDLELTCLL
jgi:hypothetical protein